MSVKLYPVIPLVYDDVTTHNAYYFKRLRSTWSARTLLIASFALHRVSVGKLFIIFHRAHYTLRAHRRDYFASKVFFKRSNLHDDFACVNMLCICVCMHISTRTGNLFIMNQCIRWTCGITGREKQFSDVKEMNVFLESLRVVRISKIFRLFCKYIGC